MYFGRLGWSDGSAATFAERAVNAGLLLRPGSYDDLIGFGVTVSDLPDSSLERQTTVEVFYRLDIPDNLALTAGVQYLNNPGFNESDPWIFGLRLRFNL